MSEIQRYHNELVAHAIENGTYSGAEQTPSEWSEELRRVLSITPESLADTVEMYSDEEPLGYVGSFDEEGNAKGQSSVVRPRKKKSKRHGFYLQAKQVFCTWSECPVSKESALEQLESICQQWGGIDKYIICEEEHKNGDPHLHAYIKVKGKRVRSKKASVFDLVMVPEVPFHGNYVGCKNPDAVKNYVKKGGRFISNIDEDFFAKLIETAKTRGVKRALEDLIESNPALFVKDGKKIKSNLELVVEDRPTEVNRLFAFKDIPPKVCMCVRT